MVVKFQGVDDGMTEFKNPATNKVIMFLVHKTNANFLSGTPASWAGPGSGQRDMC